MNSPSGSTLVIHWGQSGGGTRFHLELSRALASATDVRLSYNIDSDKAAAMRHIDAPCLSVRTYRSKVGVILGIPRLLVTTLRLMAFIKRHKVVRVISSMESIYQSLVLPLVLPRKVYYVSVIHDAVQHPGDEHVLKRLGRCLELRRADQIVTLSPSVTDGLEAQGVSSSKIQTLFHPAFEEPGSSKPARDLPTGRDVIVGVFGRLLPYKGVDIFLDAMGQLRREGVNVSGKVVGHGPEERLRDPRDTSVTWKTGWVAESEVDTIIGGFDVMALTYREASQSGVVAHAWTHGIPVVTTPVGGLPWQVEDTRCGIVADGVSANDVADAIRRLVSDPELYRESSNGALHAARRFSWSAFADELIGSSETTDGMVAL